MKNHQYLTSELLLVFSIVTAMRHTGSHCRVLVCKSLWPLFEIPSPFRISVLFCRPLQFFQLLKNELLLNKWII